MRLIHAKSLLDKVQEPDKKVPLFYTPKNNGHVRYAILSHRWLRDEKTGAKEIPFKDLDQRPFENLLQDPTLRDSLAKIKGTCSKALQHDLEYVWMDQCCIDKQNPAEVSKSITSMFKWYNMATLCFAYLSDVTWSVDYIFESKQDFKNSEWFKRGWTLQELLAPKEMHFLIPCGDLSERGRIYQN